MRRSVDQPESEPDYYRLLGVSAGASRSEIMRAFRRRAFTAHPDHGGDAAAFRDLYRARETLLHPDRRARYDRRRRTAEPAPNPADQAPGTATGPPDATGTDTDADTGPVDDPFAWASGAGPGSGGEPSGWHSETWTRTPSAYEPGFSWRRSDRFGWWRHPGTTSARSSSGRRRRWFSRSPS